MPFLSSSVISALNIIRAGGAAGVPGTLLLDLYPNASAAYSLRKLKTDYTGFAIEVRIDTTGQPVYDIGFDSNGDLDTADLLSKAGANDAYVSKWYDQSGNGLDTINPTASIQPQIVSSGSIITEGDLPTIDFNGDYLFNAGNFNYNGGVSIFSVFNSSVIAGGARIVSDDITGVQGNFIFYSDSTVSINDNGSGFNNISYSATNGNQLRTLVFNDSSGDYNILQNVSSLASGTLSGWTGPIAPSGASNIGIMASGNGAQTLVGTMQELIVWGNNQSDNREGIESNINSNYNIYWDGSQTGLLDSYPNASAAYSLRALNSAYTRPLVKVRRSDNAEQDMYAKYDGSLDTESLLNFVGAGDGFVTTWYDQSGNGNDAVNGAASTQPVIVTSGAVETLNGSPAIFADNKSLTAGSVNADDGVGQTSSFGLLNVTSDGIVISLDNSPRIARPFQVVSGNLRLLSFSPSVVPTAIDNVPYTNGTNAVASSIRKTGSLEIFNNGFSNGSTASGLLATGATALDFFHRTVGVDSITGHLAEYILYPSDQSANRLGIESNINANYNIYWDGSQTGLLDDYPDATAAYSVTALNSAYTSPLVRVRRSSDNDEQDIYALYDGTLNTEGLLSFVGTGGTDNGFITIWYDQSGSANNIIQSAAADQPQIVSSGSLITDGDGIIAPLYDGINDDMLLPGTPFAFSTDSVSLFMVAKALGNNQNAFNLADTNDYFAATYGRSTPGQLVVGYYEDGGLVNESIEGTAGTDKHLLSTIFTRGTTSLAGWINGSAMTNPATGLLRANFNTNVIGSRGGAYELNGTIQLMVIYDSDQTANRSGIETNINNYYSIYP